MNRRILWLAVVLLGVFYGCDFGSSPGGGTGVDGLTGILVDSKGNGIAGAKVRVYPAEALAKGAATAAAKADSTTTDAKGAFRFRDLPDGKYNLEASITRQDTVYSLFIGSIDFVKKLDLGRDTLRASGSLYVLVRNSSGALAGAVCSIPGSPWSAVSDAEGNCTIQGIAPGTYQVKVTAQGVTRVAENLTVTTGASTHGAVNFTPTGGGLQIPSNWLLISAQEYVFYIPPDLELQSEGYGLDSWDARYKSQSIDLRIGSLMVPLLARPDTLPGYRADTVSLDSNVRAIYIAYRNSSSGFKVGLQVEMQRSSGVSRVVFDGTATSVADSAVLAIVLRSVRVWKGPGPIPLSPPPTPQLLLPDDGSFETTTSPALSWSTPFGWSNNSTLMTGYRLQVSTSSTFAHLTVDDSVPKSAGVANAGAYRYERVPGPFIGNARYYWRVIADGPGGSTASVTRTFTTVSPSGSPVVPPLQPPAANATGLSVTPELVWTYWTGTGNTDHYRVQVSADSLFGSLIVNDSVKSPVRQSGLTTWAVRSPLTENRRYFWRVIGIGPGGATASETRSFETTPTGYVGIPIYPLQDATGVEWSPVLSWSPYYASSSSTSHRVQVSRDSLFLTLVVNDSLGPVSANSGHGGPGRMVGPLSPATKYYWRVVTYTSVGATYGRIRPFTTVAASGEAPSVPQLWAPAQGSMAMSESDTASFSLMDAESGPTTTYYHLQVAADSSFLDPIVNDSVQGQNRETGISTYKVPLKRGQQYYWRAVGVGSGGSTPAPARRFTFSVVLDD
jgi:hypothetical protein